MSEYASAIGKNKSKISEYRSAATVIQTINCSLEGTVLDKASHLAEISKAPEPEWQHLTKQLLEHGWSVKTTELAVKVKR